jgi:hypothetical protein
LQIQWLPCCKPLYPVLLVVCSCWYVLLMVESQPH